MPNTRLKRLLDKKKNALMMPKNKLAEYEEEYYELLCRIENERKKLGIDDESIRELKEDIEREYGCTDCRERASKDIMKKITAEEHAIDKAARCGDLEDIEYHKGILITLWQTASKDISVSLWQKACIKMNSGEQISLFNEGRNQWT